MLARAGYPRDRIHTIYHGTPIDPTPSSAGGFALYAGRLSREKGVETLVRASRLAPTVPLVIVGDGPVVSVVSDARDGTISYLGNVTPGRVAQLTRDAAFTLLPSECFECQPYGLLESMAHGTPVVASRLGGLAEIVQDGVNGILVRPGDAASLAGAMTELWEDRERAGEMGANAWRFAQEHFSLPEQIGRVVSLYDRVVAGDDSR
jgi:glycosyltransferase involved in cell wall biosynthesis